MIIVISEREITCRTCGQTMTSAETEKDDDSDKIGRCPTCGTILTTANSVPTIAYLKPSEYQLLIKTQQ